MGVKIAFGGFPCLDPNLLAKQQARRRLSMASWYGKANSYLTQIGPYPGRGWLLMRRGHIDQLPFPSGLSDLTIEDGAGGSVTIKDLLVIRTACQTPGVMANDPNAVHLVEVADCRWLAQNPYFANPTESQYNIRAPAGGSYTYYAESTPGDDGTTPFTWQEVLDDLWTDINVPELGVSPKLQTSPDGVNNFTNYSPNGNPEGLKFLKVPAWAAYNFVLRRLGFGFALNPLASRQAALYRIGDPDGGLTSAESTWYSRRTGDDEAQENLRAKVPAQLQICFHKFSPDYGTEPTTAADDTQWSSAPIYTVTVTNPFAMTVGLEAGSTAVLWDDMCALTDASGSVTNMSALADRANERMYDYYRMVQTGGTIRRRGYIGILSDNGFLPGLQVTGIGWYDLGGGCVTLVSRQPQTLRVADDGRWVEMPDTTSEWLRPPDLGRATVPNYPPQGQWVSVRGGASPDNPQLYDAVVEMGNGPALSFSDGEKCWAYAPMNLPLTVGNYYFGRLYGNSTATPFGGGLAESRPCYFVLGGWLSDVHCSDDLSHIVETSY
jgi:hypothetical protein